MYNENPATEVLQKTNRRKDTISVFAPGMRRAWLFLPSAGIRVAAGKKAVTVVEPAAARPGAHKKTNYLVLTLFVLAYYTAKPQACECGFTQLGIPECNKYEIIFKGKVRSVSQCQGKPGEAMFEVEELYKGNATKHFKVLFDCEGNCAVGFKTGEEWIIYSRYKQMENAKMDWCSRSRKFFRLDKEDYYSVTYGNDYAAEAQFLRQNLGLHRLLAESPTRVEQRNMQPSHSQLIIILISSMLAMILFYYLFNRFFK